MKLRNPLKQDPDGDQSDPDVIFVGPDAERKRRANARWGLALVVYMRVLAVQWMIFGVLHWTSILNPGPQGFDALPFAYAVAISVFAVAHLVAAVGLWLIAPWGGALWLATAAGEIMVGLFLGGPVAVGALSLIGYVAMIVLYFVITWFAAQERERP